MAKNTIPYQWEENLLEKSLRFDTNTLPNLPKSLPLFLDRMKKRCPINEYSDPNYTRLKQLIAKYETVTSDMITITNSGDEAIDILAKSFLDPGDYFITTPPTYEMFSIQCEINKGVSLPSPLTQNAWTINEKEIIEYSKNLKVKLIFLCNPNNPTASIIPPEIIERVVKNSQAMVIIDEVYREFYGKTSLSLLQKYDNLVILRSFSKFAAIAGARIGYLIANSSLSQKFDGIRFPMGVSFLSSKLAETILEKDKNLIKKQIKIIIKERVRLAKELIKLGFYVYPSFANFLLVKIDNASRLCRQLKQKNIILRDRSSKKYLENCIRITIRSSWENNQLLKEIKAILI